METQVDEYLKTIEVNFSVRYVGEMTQGDWNCDAWMITFSNGSKSATFEYFTGLGHRKATKLGLSRPEMKFPRNSLGYDRWKKEYVKPVPPPAIGVLYSLLADSKANEMSFNDWCLDYDYDSDSISAFNTYQACCENAIKLRKVFSGSQIVDLRKMVEDY